MNSINLIMFYFLITIICMVNCNTLPLQMISSANDNNQIKFGETRRNGRGLFQTLTGLSNVAAAAANSGLLGGGSNSIKDQHNDDDISSNILNHLSSSSSTSNDKRKPYAFSDVEMSAIQAMISIRNVLSDILHKFGVNLPSSIASFIKRSSYHNGGISGKNSILSSVSDPASIANLLSSVPANLLSVMPGNLFSTAVAPRIAAILLIRGLLAALSLAAMIAKAAAIRRMSKEDNESNIVIVPQYHIHQNPYYHGSYGYHHGYGYNQGLHRRKRSTMQISESTERMLRREEQQRIIRYIKQMEELYGTKDQQKSKDPYYVRNVFVSQPQSQESQQKQQQQQPSKHQDFVYGKRTSPLTTTTTRR